MPLSPFVNTGGAAGARFVSLAASRLFVRSINKSRAIVVVVLSNRLPFSEWAFLGCHAELCPCGASALAAAARAVECGGVPFRTGSADGFAGGEDVRRRGSEACASEAVRGVAESGEHLGAAFGYVRRERHVKTKLGIANGSSGVAG